MEMTLENIVACFKIAFAQFSDPHTAQDECYHASYAFLGLLQEGKIDAELTEGMYLDPDDIIIWDHYGVKVGDVVYDWTARQFYPPAPWPMIVPWEDWNRLHVLEVDSQSS